MIALTIQQPLGPFTSESADVDRAHAKLRKAEAGYAQARLQAEAKRRSPPARQRGEASRRCSRCLS